jgi:hypothetical protein
VWNSATCNSAVCANFRSDARARRSLKCVAPQPGYEAIGKLVIGISANLTQACHLASYLGVICSGKQQLTWTATLRSIGLESCAVPTGKGRVLQFAHSAAEFAGKVLLPICRHLGSGLRGFDNEFGQRIRA